VYLNGVKLVAGTDFTATNGTSITLATGAAVNDVVDIVAYGTFVLADHYTEAQSDARFVNITGDTMTGNLDVQGTVTADGLTVDGNANVNNNIVLDGILQLKDTGGSTRSVLSYDASDDVTISTGTSSGARSIYMITEGQNALRVHAGGDISFYDTSGNAKFFWDASAERLGLGTDSPTQALDVRGQAVVGSGTDGVKLTYSAGNSTGIIDTGFTSTGLEFRTGNSFAAVIDASGHLLVGQSSSNTPGVGNTTNGHSLRSDGLFFASAYQGRTGTFGRNGNDGPVLGIYKDGVNAGDLGAKLANGQSRLYLGNSNTKLLFDNGADRIYPVNNDGNARNGAIDLGLENVAFKDLYLTGGIQFDSRSNKLDDYEYGDYQVSLTPSGGGSITVNTSHNDLKYTKIGSRVFVSGKVDISAASSPSGYITVTLPFAIHNSGTANDSRRFNGSIWVVGSALNTYEFQLYGVEGESVVRIYNGSGTILASTAAEQFSGDEGICFDFHYETTP
jgi:hypothetical protein